MKKFFFPILIMAFFAMFAVMICPIQSPADTGQAVLEPEFVSMDNLQPIGFFEYQIVQSNTWKPNRAAPITSAVVIGSNFMLLSPALAIADSGGQQLKFPMG